MFVEDFHAGGKYLIATGFQCCQIFIPLGELAQLVERVVRNDEVRGSIPLLSTNIGSLSIAKADGRNLPSTCRPVANWASSHICCEPLSEAPRLRITPNPFINVGKDFALCRVFESEAASSRLPVGIIPIKSHLPRAGRRAGRRRGGVCR